MTTTGELTRRSAGAGGSKAGRVGAYAALSGVVLAPVAVFAGPMTKFLPGGAGDSDAVNEYRLGNCDDAQIPKYTR